MATHTLNENNTTQEEFTRLRTFMDNSKQQQFAVHFKNQLTTVVANFHIGLKYEDEEDEEWNETYLYSQLQDKEQKDLMELFDGRDILEFVQRQCPSQKIVSINSSNPGSVVVLEFQCLAFSGGTSAAAMVDAVQQYIQKKVGQYMKYTEDGEEDPWDIYATPIGIPFVVANGTSVWVSTGYERRLSHTQIQKLRDLLDGRPLRNLTFNGLHTRKDKRTAIHFSFTGGTNKLLRASLDGHLLYFLRQLDYCEMYSTEVKLSDISKNKQGYTVSIDAESG